jgi:hypothetical protein
LTQFAPHHFQAFVENTVAVVHFPLFTIPYKPFFPQGVIPYILPTRRKQFLGVGCVSELNLAPFKLQNPKIYAFFQNRIRRGSPLK